MTNRYFTEHKFILNEKGEPMPCHDLYEWGVWFETNSRIVEQTFFKDIKVSTVFLGMDHGWHDGPPVLWETMIFGGKHDQYQKRYTSLADAKAGHREALLLAMGYIHFSYTDKQLLAFTILGAALLGVLAYMFF